MANIKCKSCGKRYSYHESDLCPHCGAYNKPSARMRVDFDEEGNAELLHEREFLRQSEAGRERKDCYEQKECHEEAVRQGKRGLLREGADKISINSSTDACRISSSDLKCLIRAFLRAGPTPGISSSTDFT